MLLMLLMVANSRNWSQQATPDRDRPPHATLGDTNPHQATTGGQDGDAPRSSIIASRAAGRKLCAGFGA
jgi:hypothetical protein